MSNRPSWHQWATLGILAVAAGLLYLLPILIPVRGQLLSLSQAVADAFVVAVVVSLAVEPRLLTYFTEELGSFGEKLVTKTFWNSFYSQAPEIYRDAIKELAAASQFCTAVYWSVNFEWTDASKTIIKLHTDLTQHRQNRGLKPYLYSPNSFIYESPVPGYASRVDNYALVCSEANHFSDLNDERLKLESTDGRIQLTKADGISYLFSVPPNFKYTLLFGATTYLQSSGFFPLSLTMPTLRLVLQFGGNALDDLQITALHSGTRPGGGTSRVSGNGRELSHRGEIHVGSVFINGQVVLLSWTAQQGLSGDGRDATEFVSLSIAK